MQNMNEMIGTFWKIHGQEDIIGSWELFKFQISNFAQEYGREKASDRELLISQLSEKITNMEDVLDPSDMELLQATKLDLEELVNEKIRGVIFRSKCRFYELGEVNSKYFYSLEKSRYNAKTCHALFDEEGVLQTSVKKVLMMQECFYQELYTKDENVNFDLKNTSNIKINQELKIKHEEPFSMQEIADAVFQMPNGKSPGLDGIGIDFYKVFWKEIRAHVAALIGKIYQQRCLNPSANMGVISLIPKAGKDTRFVKNLRPITLLNSDYKIIEKALSNRIMLGLQQIIHSDQKGFMPGRKIAINIQCLFDLMCYCDQEKIEAFVLSLDFMKCFDQIDFSAIYGSLQFFGFADYIIDGMKILYSSFQAVVLNNGYFTNRISINRSVQVNMLMTQISSH